MKKEINYFNIFIQTGLVVFTAGGYLLTAFKLPQYGLLVALVSQVFWIYSSYKAWKESNQIGIFINTILMTFIIAFGIYNYFLN